MRRFGSHDEAREHLMRGGVALVVERGNREGRVYAMDPQVLWEQARWLGVKRPVFCKVGSLLEKHVVLVGAPLRKAMTECGQRNWVDDLTPLSPSLKGRGGEVW